MGSYLQDLPPEHYTVWQGDSRRPDVDGKIKNSLQHTCTRDGFYTDHRNDCTAYRRILTATDDVLYVELI